MIPHNISENQNQVVVTGILIFFSSGFSRDGCNFPDSVLCSNNRST